MTRLARITLTFVDTLPLTVLASTLCLNVWLGVQLRGARLPKQPTTQQKVAVGTVAPLFRAQTIDGQDMSFSWNGDSKFTVLYVFTPTCHWCKRNLENIKYLSSSLGSSYRFVGLSLSRRGNSEYIAGNHLHFPVYMKPDAALANGLNLGPTPQTIVISRDGKVVHSWSGAYNNSNQKEIEASFGVRLPGLTDTPQDQPMSKQENGVLR